MSHQLSKLHARRPTETDWLHLGLRSAAASTNLASPWTGHALPPGLLFAPLLPQHRPTKVMGDMSTDRTAYMRHVWFGRPPLNVLNLFCHGIAALEDRVDEVAVLAGLAMLAGGFLNPAAASPVVAETMGGLTTNNNKQFAMELHSDEAKPCQDYVCLLVVKKSMDQVLDPLACLRAVPEKLSTAALVYCTKWLHQPKLILQKASTRVMSPAWLPQQCCCRRCSNTQLAVLRSHITSARPRYALTGDEASPNWLAA